MKTALLLSWHMRNYKAAFDNQKTAIIEPNNCDVFIVTSTVDTHVYLKGMKGTKKTHASYHQPCEDGSQGYVEIIQHDKNALEEQIRDFYGPRLKGLIINEENIDDVITKNSLPVAAKAGGHGFQWLRVKQSNELKNAYEQQAGEKYSAVIRSRTDLVFKNQLRVSDYNLSNKDVFLCQHHAYPKIEIHDQFAFGSSTIMNIYCDLHDYYGTFRKPSQLGLWKSEHELTDYLISKNIIINKIPHKPFFGMVRGGLGPQDDKYLQLY